MKTRTFVQKIKYLENCIIRASKDYDDGYSKIIDLIENDSDLFEIYSYFYLKASSTGQVYHSMDFNSIPHEYFTNLKLDILSSGASVEGMDIIEIKPNLSIGYECKRYFNQNIKKGLSHKEVANKNIVIKQTNVDKLYFITNKNSVSFRAEKFNPDVDYILRDEIYSKENYFTVFNFVINKKKKYYETLSYRDELVKELVDEYEDNLTTFLRVNEIDNIRTWIKEPARTFKGSVPPLLYYNIFSKLKSKLGFKDKVINLAVTHNTAVLNQNLTTLVSHDLATKQNSIHIYCSDIRKGMSLSKLEMVSRNAEYAVTPEHLRLLLKKYENKTIWIHVLMSSYTQYLEKINKKIFFSWIDEVKHAVGHQLSTWKDCLDDSIADCRIRIMGDANERTTEGNSFISMNSDAFQNVYFREISEKLARERNYKRTIKLEVCSFDYNFYSTLIRDSFLENSIPIVSVNGTKIPFTYVEQTYANFITLIKRDLKYLMYTFNQVDDIVNFEKAYEPLKVIILDALLKQGVLTKEDPIYSKLLKRKFYVCDTKSVNTSKVRKMVDSIPFNNPDGASFGHVYLLGEGWTPGRGTIHEGWVQGCCFMERTSSPIRMYQNVNRITTLNLNSNSNYKRKDAYFIIAQHKSEFETEFEHHYRNRLFRELFEIGNKLQLGNDVSEHIIFREFKTSGGGGGGGTRGSDELEAMLELNAEDFNSSYRDWVANGSNFVKSYAKYMYLDAIKEFKYRYDFLRASETDSFLHSAKLFVHGNHLNNEAFGHMPDYIDYIKSEEGDIQYFLDKVLDLVEEYPNKIQAELHEIPTWHLIKASGQKLGGLSNWLGVLRKNGIDVSDFINPTNQFDYSRVSKKEFISVCNKFTKWRHVENFFKEKYNTPNFSSGHWFRVNNVTRESMRKHFKKLFTLEDMLKARKQYSSVWSMGRSDIHEHKDMVYWCQRKEQKENGIWDKIKNL